MRLGVLQFLNLFEYVGFWVIIYSTWYVDAFHDAEVNFEDWSVFLEWGFVVLIFLLSLFGKNYDV